MVESRKVAWGEEKGVEKGMEIGERSQTTEEEGGKIQENEEREHQWDILKSVQNSILTELIDRSSK